jgi:hypothetical protein
MRVKSRPWRSLTSPIQFWVFDLLGSFTATNGRVPHISLVFREMWDTTNLKVIAYGVENFQVYTCGIKRIRCWNDLFLQHLQIERRSLHTIQLRYLLERRLQC